MANKLTNAQSEFVVRKLAALDSPRAIVIDFVAIFPGCRIDENDVRRLDPNNGPLSLELHSAYTDERARILANPEQAAPYIVKANRLVGMDRQARFYIGNNQLAEARAVWRQMAEETGDIGPKGKPGAAPSESAEPIVRITRTVVDPKVPEPSGAET